jgi:hypothetical protein
VVLSGIELVVFSLYLIRTQQHKIILPAANDTLKKEDWVVTLLFDGDDWRNLFPFAVDYILLL